MCVLFCFFERFLLCSPGWLPTHDPPASISQIVGIVNLYHHTGPQPYLWIIIGQGSQLLCSLIQVYICYDAAPGLDNNKADLFLETWDLTGGCSSLGTHQKFCHVFGCICSLEYWHLMFTSTVFHMGSDMYHSFKAFTAFLDYLSFSFILTSPINPWKMNLPLTSTSWIILM
jgi:hypothetical protein